VFAGGLEFVSDETQLEEPASEGVLWVVGDRPCRAGGLAGKGLMADGHAKLDVAFDLPCVEGRVEGAELDGVRGALGGEGRVKVEKVVAASVVVAGRSVGPVAFVVPNRSEGFHRAGLACVQTLKEVLFDGLAPLVSAAGADAQGLCQKVFLRVDDVDQPPQAFGGVFPEPDVDVDSAGSVHLGARLADGADHLLDHLDVLPAANRADHLCRGVGDRAVALDCPLSAVGHRDFPVTQVCAYVVCGRTKVVCDGLRGLFASQARGFQFDAESLVFHGVASFSFPVGCSPRRDTFITLFARNSNPTEPPNNRPQRRCAIDKEKTASYIARERARAPAREKISWTMSSP